jgi:hypothetical protein
MNVIFQSVRNYLEERAKSHSESEQSQRDFMLGSCEMLLASVLYDVSKCDKPLFDQWMKYLSEGRRYE